MGVSIFSPAKINLYLAVTGRRADGYHDLVSVAAPLDFGDQLDALPLAAGSRPEGGTSRQFALECDRPEVPVDESNLILRAAQAFAAMTGWSQPVAFKLTKRIPLGAGLGGGSSNAVAALRAMNELSGGLLAEAQLAELAAALGSDCAMFLHRAPVVMRGRGDRVDRLPAPAERRITGQRVLLFKPSFAISTPWAYGRMVARGGDYRPAGEAEIRFASWLEGAAPLGELLSNNMEAAAFEKYIALPVLLGKLHSECGVTAHLSGSGSACYALLDRPAPGSGPPDLVARMRHVIGTCWGPAAFVQEARII